MVLQRRKPLDFNELLWGNSAYAELLTANYQPLSQQLAQWAAAPYDKNPSHPEGKIHKCCTGEFVRSKSEAMIALALHLHKIPFRYECALKAGSSMVYPDFTIRHPKTGEIYYWENFGMMDDARYAENAANRFKFYISQGIIPSIQLITTYEQRDKPLSTSKVESLILEFFGDGI